MKRGPTEMEERVARVIEETDMRMMHERLSKPRPRPKWLGPGGAREQEYLAQARAAIAAMRDPTCDMVHESARVHTGAGIPIAPHTSAWQSMIDAASPPDGDEG